MNAVEDNVKPIIAGAAMTPFGRFDDGSTFRDWIRTVSAEAIRDAAIDRSDIDSVIVASESDMLSAQVSPAALAVDEIGLQGASAVHVEMGGASGAAALREGFAQICAGIARHVLVVGFDQTASRLSRAGVQQVYGLSFDADIEGWQGVTTANLYALSFKMYCSRYSMPPECAAPVSVKNHGNAMHNPLAHKPMHLTVSEVADSAMISDPYRLLDCSMVSDAAAAVVLSRINPVALRGDMVRIAGSGCGSDFVKLGDRPNPHKFSAKLRSAAAAYAMAGIRDPALQIDVVESYDAFSGAELQGLEALALAEPGCASQDLAKGKFCADGALPVNLSGGLIGQGGSPGATGIAQAVTMRRLLQGTYEARLQPKHALRRGIIDSHSGVCTVSVTHVLERVDSR